MVLPLSLIAMLSKTISESLLSLDNAPIFAANGLGVCALARSADILWPGNSRAYSNRPNKVVKI